MITETVCADSPVMRAISDLASGAVPPDEAEHQPLVLRAHARLIRPARQSRTDAASRAVLLRLRSHAGIRLLRVLPGQR